MQKHYNFGIIVIMLITFALLLFANFGWANTEFNKPFNDALKGNVRNGEVNYKAIKDNPSFQIYIESLKNEPTFENKIQEVAYWINAYNALVIKGILEGGSPSNFFSRQRFFKNDKYELAGKHISLNDLEHKVIIPLDEPRIHFAINCASSSCPKLRPSVFNADMLDKQLTDAAYAFINDTMRNYFDPATKIAYISKIFDWFERDFVKHSGSVEEYIAQYINDKTIAEDLRAGNYKIKYLKYDWTLNGTKP